jgi:hypothetical protein
MQHLGYKSAMVNISDVFAMNGTPRQMIVSLALSKRFSVEDMEEFYNGLKWPAINGMWISWEVTQHLLILVWQSASPALAKLAKRISFTGKVRVRPI